MSMFTISTLNVDPEIRENLLQEISFLSREGIQVNLAEEISGKFLLFNCSVVEDENPEIISAHEKALRYYLAYIITDLLMNGITKALISRLAKNRYRYLGTEELGLISQTAFSFLNNLQNDEEITKTLSRHNEILSRVSEYLNTNTNLYLEGFLRFRLKEYFKEIEVAVEQAIDNFLVEREYLEFIKLLRYFVEIQEPRIDEVQVLIKDQQCYYLLDEEKKPINQKQLEGVLTDLYQEVDYEDLLLSALITISPRRIILHVINQTEVVETIMNVFGERVQICRGCDFCSPELKSNKVFSKLVLQPE